MLLAVLIVEQRLLPCAASATCSAVIAVARASAARARRRPRATRVRARRASPRGRRDDLRDHARQSIVARRRPARRARARVLERRGAASTRKLGVGQRLEPHDARARQQRRDDLEARVLGRRADQRDSAGLDVGQQRVLLGLVEAMDLVDEQQRPRADWSRRVAALAIASRTSLTPASTADSATARRCSACRAAARAWSCRSPVGPTGSTTGWRGRAPGSTDASGPDQVGLPDELLERPRPHPLGQRLADVSFASALRKEIHLLHGHLYTHVVLLTTTSTDLGTPHPANGATTVTPRDQISSR